MENWMNNNVKKLRVGKLQRGFGFYIKVELLKMEIITSQRVIKRWARIGVIVDKVLRGVQTSRIEVEIPEAGCFNGHTSQQ